MHLLMHDNLKACLCPLVQVLCICYKVTVPPVKHALVRLTSEVAAGLANL